MSIWATAKLGLHGQQPEGSRLWQQQLLHLEAAAPQLPVRDAACCMWALAHAKQDHLGAFGALAARAEEQLMLWVRQGGLAAPPEETESLEAPEQEGGSAAAGSGWEAQRGAAAKPGQDANRVILSAQVGACLFMLKRSSSSPRLPVPAQLLSFLPAHNTSMSGFSAPTGCCQPGVGHGAHQPCCTLPAEGA